MRTKFKNADEAYDYFLDKIIVDGVSFSDTKALFNVGFTLKKPMENYIFNKERNWKPDYAIAEWKWYYLFIIISFCHAFVFNKLFYFISYTEHICTYKMFILFFSTHIFCFVIYYNVCLIRGLLLLDLSCCRCIVAILIYS